MSYLVVRPFLAGAVFAVTLLLQLPALSPAHADFITQQTLVPATSEKPLDLVLERSRTSAKVPVSDLRLVVTTDTGNGLSRAAADKVTVLLRFYADNAQWEVKPEPCVTPHDFGADFPGRDYDPDNDLVCVICCDGGNFAIRPLFDDDGVARSYNVLFRFASEAKTGYDSLRVDDGPPIFLHDAKTFEPLYNGLTPRKRGMKRTVHFVDRH